MRKVVLVIAFKFNDILYAINTVEFKQADYHKLIIFYNDAVSPSDYPCLGAFDTVKCIHYTHDLKSVAKSIVQVFKIKKMLRADCMITSIPLLLIIRFIFNLSKVQDVIWIEDGLLNYVKPESDLLKTSTVHAKIKQIVQLLLGVDEMKLVNKISSTYLLLPDEAIYYYGTKKKLTVDSIDYKEFDFLEGKKLLIGQNLYPHFCSFDDYIRITNDVISRLNIDYYIPHLLADLRENDIIKGNVLNLSKKGVTLEMLASTYNFTIVSYGSSLLYTAKVINCNVYTIYIKLPFYDISSFPVIVNHTDKIIDNI